MESVAHLPSPPGEKEEEEIVIGREDLEETRRIQDKWRDILSNEKDWPGHEYEYDIVVSTNFNIKVSMSYMYVLAF